MTSSHDPPRITLSIGAQGSGKTFASNRVAAELLSSSTCDVVLALDVGSAGGRNDWPQGPLAQWLRDHHARHYVAQDKDGVRRGIDRGHRVVLLRPYVIDGPDLAPYLPDASALAEIAIARQETFAVCWSETHLAFPCQGPRPTRAMVQAATRARHHGIYVVAETQHVARLHTLLRDEGRWLVHQTPSVRDRQRVAEHIEGQSRYTRTDAITAMEALSARGQPGWHIVIDGADTDLTPRR